MRRTELPELHDHTWFPGFLRDLVTDALQALWRFGNSYRPILPRLSCCIKESSTGKPAEVLDLCSGGGGPWFALAHQLECDYSLSVAVCLTDKYPNREASEDSDVHGNRGVESHLTRSTGSRVSFNEDMVDATRVPASLCGFRTMFSSFHHFGPEDAREVLRSAAKANAGIGIFEVAERGMKTMLVLCVTPFLVLLLTPWIRPFRWSRIFWTYLVPVVPFVIWFDGWVSCLRAYSLQELQEMIDEMEQQTPLEREYRWQFGVERTGLIPVTYLLGSPGNSRTSLDGRVHS